MQMSGSGFKHGGQLALEGLDGGMDDGPRQQRMSAYDDDEYGNEFEESQYSEGDLLTRKKIVYQKSYSAPYLFFSDCYDEPLCDDTGSKELGREFNSTTMLQNIELQPEGDEDGQAMDENMMEQALLQ